MTRSQWKTVLVSGLVSIFGMLAVHFGLAPVRGAGSTDNNGELIAVTGDYGNGTSVLYVIDTRTRNLAVYRSMNGNNIELVAARRILHDLKLVTYQDKSAANVNPLELEKNYNRYMDGRAPSPLGDVVPEAAEKTEVPASLPTKEKK